MGNWETDIIIGNEVKWGRVTLDDIKSRFLRKGLMEHRTKEFFKESMIELLKGYSVDTITCDNIKEFAVHEEMAQVLKAEIYFVHPYAS